MRIDITIRNIEQSLVQRLSQEAEKKGLDVNSFLIAILSKAVPSSSFPKEGWTLEELGGTSENEEYEAIFTSQSSKESLIAEERGWTWENDQYQAINASPSSKESWTLEELGGTWDSDEYKTFTENTAPFEEIDKQIWQ